MTLVRRNSNWLPDVFSDIFDTAFYPQKSTMTPAVNVKESDTAYTVELAAPGLKKEDFDVQINDEGDLHVKIEHKEEKKDENKQDHYLRREFSYSNYEQTLILPDDVDKEKISAKCEHGVLTVNLPKVVPAEQPKLGRKVEIA